MRFETAHINCDALPLLLPAPNLNPNRRQNNSLIIIIKLCIIVKLFPNIIMKIYYCYHENIEFLGCF